MTWAMMFATSEKTSRIDREVDERVDLKRRVRSDVLARDAAGEGVAGLEQRPVDGNAVADHLGDGDRLSDGAAQPEDHRRRDPCPGIGEGDPASHFPACCAECQRTVLELLRHAEEQLTADARDDRDDHDRQDQDRREHARADGRLRAEDRQETERAVQGRGKRVHDEGAEHENAPEAEHDAGNGGQHVDEDADGAPYASRCELGQEERDRDRDRPCEQQGAERRDGGADDERRRAEELFVRVPGLGRQELEPELLHRGPCFGQELARDQPEQNDAG